MFRTRSAELIQLRGDQAVIEGEETQIPDGELDEEALAAAAAEEELALLEAGEEQAAEEEVVDEEALAAAAAEEEQLLQMEGEEAEAALEEEAVAPDGELDEDALAAAAAEEELLLLEGQEEAVEEDGEATAEDAFEQAAVDQMLAGFDMDEVEVEETMAELALGEEVPDELLNGDAEAQEEEAEAEEEVDMNLSEDLRDAVDGSLRLKRLLSRDDSEDAGGVAKKRKIGEEQDSFQVDPVVKAKADALLKKWNCSLHATLRYLLETCTVEELDQVYASSFMPDLFHSFKTVAETVTSHFMELRARSLPGGGPQDCVTAFRWRHKLSMEQTKLLRGLSHKSLRYVMSNYDSALTLEELIEQAEEHFPDEVSQYSALPDYNGIKACGRFGRLELIDPMSNVATFGDANLTFSLKLAKHRKVLGDFGRFIATTFEERDTLRERYTEIDASISTLEEHGAEVYHGVDCTRISLDTRFEELVGDLGAAYYNFPHSGLIQGFFDGHPIVNWRHENLMRLFFRALRPYMKQGGQVKVASNMNAVGVRYSYIMQGALENEFIHVETFPFLEWCLHRYGRSYGDRRDTYKRPDAKNNQSYNSQRAEADMVYCFRYEPSGEEIPRQYVRPPPTFKTLCACTDGPFKHILGPAKIKLAEQLHARFITEVSGRHVG